jgi:UDP-GlcNAc:undecaprenyl-phosphate GlcNAc-1-phosphate transferase
MMAWMTFRLTQTPSHPVTPLLALWLLPIPIMDCLVLMARRLKLGQSPFRADHNHIHHLMMEAGFTPTRVALTLAAFSCASGLLIALALRAHWSHNLLLGAFFLMCVVWYWLTGRRARVMAFLGASKVNEPAPEINGKVMSQESGR